MKKIKLLLPLWLILLYFGSIIFMIQDRQENIASYQKLVNEARNYVKNDVIVDAVDSYEAAMDISPSIDLAIEVGDLYLKQESYQEAQGWYTENLYGKYPDQPETYEYGIRMYLAQNNYCDAFIAYDEYKGRRLYSDEVEAMMEPIWYTFDLSGQYDECRPFGNISKIAAVRSGNYWGYVDTSGERVLDYIYVSAGTFGDLGAVTDQNGNAYFTDSSGNKKITDKSILEKDPDFGKVEAFKGIESGMLWAFNGNYWNCYDAQTYEKLFGGYTDVTNIVNSIGGVKDESGKWALIGADGKLLTDFQYDDILTDQKDVPCRTSAVIVKQGDTYVLVDTDGKQIGKAEYEDACAFFDDTYAAVKTGGKWLFVDDKGNVQDLGTYDQAESFSNGLAAVCLNGKWGYIDLNGNLVIDCQFIEAGPFCASGTAFVKPEEKEYWQILSLYKNNHES